MSERYGVNRCGQAIIDSGGGYRYRAVSEDFKTISVYRDHLTKESPNWIVEFEGHATIDEIIELFAKDIRNSSLTRFALEHADKATFCAGYWSKDKLKKTIKWYLHEHLLRP